MIAVTYGLARFAYGLFLPEMRETLDLSDATLGLIGAGSYAGYCLAVLGALVLTSRSGPRLLAVAARPGDAGAPRPFGRDARAHRRRLLRRLLPGGARRARAYLPLRAAPYGGSRPTGRCGSPAPFRPRRSGSSAPAPTPATAWRCSARSCLPPAPGRALWR